MVHILCKRTEKQPLRYRLTQDLLVRFLAARAGEFREARGQDLAVLANDWIGINACVDGFYERPVLDLVFDFLKPLASFFSAGVALDVGANIGNHAVYMSPFFKSVTAFEPHPLVQKILAINAELAGNISPVFFGVGERDEFMRLEHPQGNIGGSTLVGTGAPLTEGKGMTADIAIKPLDDLLEGGSTIELIKIDVEGSEPAVIKGGLDVLRANQPIVLFEQLEDSFNQKHKSTEAIELLLSEGYSICWIESPGEESSGLGAMMGQVTRKLRGERRLAVVFGDAVPSRSHPMLIAVPARHQVALGLRTS